MNPLPRNPVQAPRVLVVDDDRRVLELLEIAYQNQGWQVVSARDGDEAYRRALAEPLDLVVLDVRLPRRSGFEVCEALRSEAPLAALPIILLSAAGETETRLQGLASGADDFLAKPFSPKELLARSRRLLARTVESREARQRARDLERELERARDEVRRSHLETRHEHRLRELAYGLGRDLQGLLDERELTSRVLAAAEARLGVRAVALLVPAHDSDLLEPAAAPGDAHQRAAGIALARDGALARRLAAIGRPVLRRSLDRLEELQGELPALLAAGFALVAPLGGPEGLEALLLAGERADGIEPQVHDLELLGGLCDLAGLAWRNARRHRAPLERAVELLANPGADPLRAEAAALVGRAARAAGLAPYARAALAHAAALGAAADRAPVRDALERLAAEDASGWVAGLIDLIARSRAPVAPHTAGDPAAARAAVLAGFARRLVAAREGGEPLATAAARAADALGEALDPVTRRALESATRDRLALADRAA